MSNQRLTPTKEDYVLVLYRLSNDKIRIVDIAKHLGLSKSTVTERIQDLAKQNLVFYKKYGDLTLTEAGVELGKKLMYKHRILEVFLHKILGLSADQVHEEAHVLEHACSDLVIQKLAEFLQHPTHDPHGKPIEPFIL